MLGVDLHAQRAFNPAALRADGVQFAYLKASEGATFTDPAWATRSREARAAGLNVGGYHFCRPDLGHTPREEAAHFIDVLHSGVFNLVPALDYEVGPYSQMWAQGFLQALREEFGAPPLLYASTSKLSALTVDHNRIWQADYGPNDGRQHLPGGVAKGHVYIHQYTSVGKLPHGYEGDLNKATQESLTALLLGSKPRPKRLRWLVEWTDRKGGQARHETRHPVLWAQRHPRSFKRGAVNFRRRRG